MGWLPSGGETDSGRSPPNRTKTWCAIPRPLSASARTVAPSYPEEPLSRAAPSSPTPPRRKAPRASRAAGRGSDIDRLLRRATELWAERAASGEGDAFTPTMRRRIGDRVRLAAIRAAGRDPDPELLLAGRARLRSEPFALLDALDGFEQTFFAVLADPGPDADAAALLEQVGAARDGFASVREALFARVRRTVAASTSRVQALSSGLDHADRLASVGTMAAGLAHELNNMLGGVQAYAELALGRDDRATMRRALRQIERVGTRSVELTRSLLSAAHKQEPNKASHALAGIVRDSVKLLRPKLDRDGVAVRLTVAVAKKRDARTPDETSLRVVADRAQLEQVLVNLILNARDAIAERHGAGGGKITIRFGRRGKFGTVRVKDDGPGIPESELERIFEPFYTTKERADGVGGTGLGLPVSLGMVESNGGRLEVKSRVGKGTTFTVLVPLDRRSSEEVAQELEESADSEVVEVAPRRRKGEGAAGADEDDAARPAALITAGVCDESSKPRRILVIDDEQVVRSLFCDLIGTLGHEVVVAASVREGRKLAERGPIDLLIADYVVPGMKGVEIVERFQREHPGLKVILTTGRVPMGDPELKALIDASDAFLEKPFSLAAARDTIIGLLELRRLAEDAGVRLSQARPARPDRISQGAV